MAITLGKCHLLHSAFLKIRCVLFGKGVGEEEGGSWYRKYGTFFGSAKTRKLEGMANMSLPFFVGGANILIRQ